LHIRTKTLAIVGTMVLALIGVLTAASYLLVTDRFARLEIKEVQTQVLRVHNGLNDTIANLEAMAADWAPWDNTYRFIQDLNEAYVEENLVDSTFANLRVNFMLFFDADNRIVYSRFYELTPSQPLLDADAIIDEIRKYPTLLKHADAKSRVSGILVAGPVPYLVAAQPIVTSKFELPIRGTLMFGRALDRQEVQRIGIVTQTDLAIHGIGNPVLKVSRDSVLPALTRTGRILAKPISAHAIAAYDTISDLNGRAALIVEIVRDRQVYQDGLATWKLNALTMIASGLFFIILMMMLLDRFVLNRIEDLVRRVNNLAGSTDGLGRLEIGNFDEIGQLAQSINTMLESLHRYHSMQIASEKNYRAVVEDQTELICRTDENGRLTFVNGAFGRFFDSDALIGNSISELMPSFWEQVVEENDSGKDDRTSRDIRHNILSPHGQERCLQWHIRHIHSESPENSGYQMVGKDITEQTAAEAALQENERYLRELLDSINCGVMVIDIRQRCIVDINAAGAKLFKRERQEIVGRTCHSFVCPDEAGACPVIDHQHCVDLSERALLQADGSLLPILKSVTRTERRGRSYLIESFIDISHLRKIEADLRQSEERYRRFFEEDITGDFLASVDGRIIACNHAFAVMFGYQSIEEVKAVHSEQFYPPKGLYTLLLRRLLKERRLEGIEFELRHKSGRPIYCIGNLVGHFDDKGNLKEVGGYLFDDTKRVLLEKNLRQAQKMEAIGTLAGGIAHDFNNILSGIMGYTEIALNELPAASPTAGRLKRVIKAADRARELVHQILTFSRQGESDGRPIQLAMIIKEAVKLVRAGLPATINIRQRVQSHATIMADPVQIHQVIMNLCTNAGHAMKKQGGLLSISVDEVKLDTSFTDRYIGVEPGPFACISVEDTGEGIPPEIMDRIFDPFFTTKGKTEGTGLGLSVVHGIVCKLNGAITVTSTARGSRFDVYLPCIHAGGEVLPVQSHDIPRGTESIVLIDDEDFQVDIGTQMLETLGYHVTGFTDSMEAFKYITENANEIDLVITDMTMPKLTGIGLTRQLLAQVPDMPIILCTGYSEEINAETAAGMGVKGFIMKPVLIKDMGSKIREILDGPSPEWAENPQKLSKSIA
jgi:PAS domain S-box-containing protein